MLKIGIVGYFGYNNLGDEWFVWTWRNLFKEHAEVYVIHPLERIDYLDGIIIGGGDLVLPTQINNNYFRDELYEKPY